jgi:hypothetical protein
MNRYQEFEVSYDELTPEARELHLYQANHYKLHIRQERPIIDNLLSKISRNVYVSFRAEKLAGYLMNNASSEYKDTFGYGFTPDARREAATYWVAIFEADTVPTHLNNLINELISK